MDGQPCLVGKFLWSQCSAMDESLEAWPGRCRRLTVRGASLAAGMDGLLRIDDHTIADLEVRV